MFGDKIKQDGQHMQANQDQQDIEVELMDPGQESLPALDTQG